MKRPTQLFKGIKQQFFKGNEQQFMARLRRSLYKGRPEDFLREVQMFIAGIPYNLLCGIERERTYHLILHLMCQMAGLDARSELCRSAGRLDMEVLTPKYVYIMEFKFNMKAESALTQINKKGYALKWEHGERKVFKIGVNFSKDTHTIKDWEIERS